MKAEITTIQAINHLLTKLKKDFISDEHRHDEFNWDCAECKARILEGGLNWWLDLKEWDREQDKKDEKVSK